MKGFEALKALMDGEILIDEHGEKYKLYGNTLYKLYCNGIQSREDWVTLDWFLCKRFSIYTDDETLSFSDVIDSIKDGKRFSRKGWNGKGQYIEMQNPDINSKMTEPYLYIKIINKNLVPWTPSQTDMFADDWYEVK